MPDDSKFCPSCGKNPVAVCENCGKPLEQGQQFCTSCGSRAVPLGALVSGSQTAGGSYQGHTVSSPQPPEFSAPGSTSPSEARRKKGAPPIWFWTPFSVLLVISAGLFWYGKTSLVGWAILAVCFVLLFFVREQFVRAGVFLNAGGWVVAVAVLFLTLGATTGSREGGVTIDASKSSQAAPTAVTSTPKNVSAAATPASNSGSSAPTVAKGAASPPTRVKMPPPEMLKPLVSALGKPVKDAKFEFTSDGDNSDAWLHLQIDGGTVSMYNLSGDTNWWVNIYFDVKEDRSQRGFQGQLKSTRENEKNMDQSLALAWIPSAESAVGKGDEGFIFSRSNKDQPLYQMRTYVVRQGATYFNIGTQENTEKPVVPGDGIDILLAELKKIDNKSLIASAASGGSAGAASAPSPTAAPSPTSVPSSASGMKLQNVAVGLGLSNDQKIQNPTNVFKPDAAEIFLSAEVTNVAGESSVDIHWTYLGTNETINGPTQKITDDARVGFSLTKPNNGWPVGQYKAVLLLNGKEAGSITFSVQQ